MSEKKSATHLDRVDLYEFQAARARRERNAAQQQLAQRQLAQLQQERTALDAAEQGVIQRILAEYEIGKDGDFDVDTGAIMRPPAAAPASPPPAEQ